MSYLDKESSISFFQNESLALNHDFGYGLVNSTVLPNVVCFLAEERKVIVLDVTNYPSTKVVDSSTDLVDVVIGDTDSLKVHDIVLIHESEDLVIEDHYHTSLSNIINTENLVDFDGWYAHFSGGVALDYLPNGILTSDEKLRKMTILADALSKTFLPHFDTDLTTPKQAGYTQNPNVIDYFQVEQYLTHNTPVDLSKIEDETRVRDTHTANIYHGAVGEIVHWFGDAYGLERPDNLHPCDGSQILNEKAVPQMFEMHSPNLKGRVLAGSNEPDSSEHNGYVKGQDAFSIDNINLPRGEMGTYTGINSNSYVTLYASCSGVNGGSTGSSHNVSTTTNTALRFTNHSVWSYRDTGDNTDPWDGASSLSGSGNSYPRITYGDGASHSTDHDHSTNIQHNHTITCRAYADDINAFDLRTKMNPYNTQENISTLQPTMFCDTFIVIY